MPALPIIEGGGPKYRSNRTDEDTYFLVYGHGTPRDEAAVIGQGLPARNTLYRGLLVRNVELVQSLTAVIEAGQDGHSEIWVVQASNLITGNIGTRRSSYQGPPITYDEYVPGFKLFTPSVGAAFYVSVPEKERYRFSRIKVDRRHTRQTSGLTENDVFAYDAANVNKIRSFNGVKFQYLGTTLFTGQDNQQRTTAFYQFRTGFKALPAVTTGYHADIQALPPNGDYIPKPSGLPITSPSVIVTDPEIEYGLITVNPVWDP